MLLDFSAGEDCPCPEDIQEELHVFHDDLRLHCGITSVIVSQSLFYCLTNTHIKCTVQNGLDVLFSHVSYVRTLKINETSAKMQKILCGCAPAGIPMEEEEEEPDTSIKGRLLSLLYKIKGRPQKTEEQPSEDEQAAPSKPISLYKTRASL